MKRTKNTIGGKQYWYAWDSVYIDKGVSKQTTKSLGPVETSSEESIRKKEAEFLTLMEQREASERFKYWKKKTHDVKAFDDKVVEEIESTRARLYRAKRELGTVAQGALDTAFLIDFIYNSNKLEGSRVPRKEVERLITEGDKKANEVNATRKAKDYIDKKFTFTIKSLQKAQEILLFDEPSKQGIRKTPIIVGNDASVSNPSEIRRDLQKLFKWYQKESVKLYPPERAFEFYFRFEKIHPFQDGNGRIGRLVMNKILKDSKYHPIIVWNKNRKAHFGAFERASGGYRTAIHQFMITMMLQTYTIYLKKIEPAKTFSELVSHFLSPSDY
jgi:Fic family protein